MKNVFEAPCKYPNCDGKELVIQKEPEGGRHFARAVCPKCKRHNQWIPKPANIKINDPRAGAILSYKYMLDNRPKLKVVQKPITHASRS